MSCESDNDGIDLEVDASQAESVRGGRTGGSPERLAQLAGDAIAGGVIAAVNVAKGASMSENQHVEDLDLESADADSVVGGRTHLRAEEEKMEKEGWVAKECLEGGGTLMERHGQKRIIR